MTNHAGKWIRPPLSGSLLGEERGPAVAGYPDGGGVNVAFGESEQRPMKMRKLSQIKPLLNLRYQIADLRIRFADGRVRAVCKRWLQVESGAEATALQTLRVDASAGWFADGELAVVAECRAMLGAPAGMLWFPIGSRSGWARRQESGRRLPHSRTLTRGRRLHFD